MKHFGYKEAYDNFKTFITSKHNQGLIKFYREHLETEILKKIYCQEIHSISGLYDEFFYCKEKYENKDYSLRMLKLLSFVRTWEFYADDPSSNENFVIFFLIAMQNSKNFDLTKYEKPLFLSFDDLLDEIYKENQKSDFRKEDFLRIYNLIKILNLKNETEEFSNDYQTIRHNNIDY